MKRAELDTDQKEAVAKMHNGCVLVGDVGTGKSRTALYYYVTRVCGKGGAGPPLFIITTARKRDTRDWEKEAEPFELDGFSVDSWNNIGKYKEVSGAFFIFDEQRLVGTGKWAKAFRQIARKNQWILLSATPGDCWNDYANLFVANGYFRSISDFRREHVIYSRFTRYPKIEGYSGIGKLVRYRREIVVRMDLAKKTVRHTVIVDAPYDHDFVKGIMKTRWNPYLDEPIQDAGALCYILRKAVNSDPRRISVVEHLLEDHPKAVIFYNFDYELELLRQMAGRIDIFYSEWNGHRHEAIPKEKPKWIYLVQYAAGAEGWNCIETDTMIFYSQNYSYKCMVQAAGRIDRRNTPYTDLYYYHICSKAAIDIAIRRAIGQKRNFNERLFAG